MAGYLNQPAKTAEVVHDGWYNTGDMAKIDDDGFIHITGRQSRFSKIAGEMVPHIRLEELLTRIVEDPRRRGRRSPHRGDGRSLLRQGRTPDRPAQTPDKIPDEILKQLSEAEIPNLWLPSADSFIEVPEIPVLGTGKLDLRALKQLALEKTNSEKTNTEKTAKEAPARAGPLSALNWTQHEADAPSVACVSLSRDSSIPFAVLPC